MAGLGLAAWGDVFASAAAGGQSTSTPLFKDDKIRPRPRLALGGALFARSLDAATRDSQACREQAQRRLQVENEALAKTSTSVARGGRSSAHGIDNKASLAASVRSKPQQEKKREELLVHYGRFAELLREALVSGGGEQARGAPALVTSPPHATERAGQRKVHPAISSALNFHSELLAVTDCAIETALRPLSRSPATETDVVTQAQRKQALAALERIELDRLCSSLPLWEAALLKHGTPPRECLEFGNDGSVLYAEDKAWKAGAFDVKGLCAIRLVRSSAAASRALLSLRVFESGGSSPGPDAAAVEHFKAFFGHIGPMLVARREACKVLFAQHLQTDSDLRKAKAKERGEAGNSRPIGDMGSRIGAPIRLLQRQTKEEAAALRTLQTETAPRAQSEAVRAAKAYLQTCEETARVASAFLASSLKAGDGLAAHCAFGRLQSLLAYAEEAKRVLAEIEPGEETLPSASAGYDSLPDNLLGLLLAWAGASVNAVFANRPLFALGSYLVAPNSLARGDGSLRLLVGACALAEALACSPYLDQENGHGGAFAGPVSRAAVTKALVALGEAIVAMTAESSVTTHCSNALMPSEGSALAAYFAEAVRRSEFTKDAFLALQSDSSNISEPELAQLFCAVCSAAATASSDEGGVPVLLNRVEALAAHVHHRAPRAGPASRLIARASRSLASVYPSIAPALAALSAMFANDSAVQTFACEREDEPSAASADPDATSPEKHRKGGLLRLPTGAALTLPPHGRQKLVDASAGQRTLPPPTEIGGSSAAAQVHSSFPAAPSASGIPLPDDVGCEELGDMDPEDSGWFGLEPAETSGLTTGPDPVSALVAQLQQGVASLPDLHLHGSSSPTADSGLQHLNSDVLSSLSRLQALRTSTAAPPGLGPPALPVDSHEERSDTEALVGRVFAAAMAGDEAIEAPGEMRLPSTASFPASRVLATPAPTTDVHRNPTEMKLVEAQQQLAAMQALWNARV